MAESKENGAGAPEISQDPLEYVGVPLESVPLDMNLPYSIYVKVAGQFILFRNQGDKLTSQRALALQGKNVAAVSVHATEWTAFMKTLENLDDGDPVDVESSIMRLRHLLLAYGQELEKNRSLQRETFQKLGVVGHKLAEGLRQKPALGTKLLRRYKDPSFYFVNHTVNVATYSAAVANKLRLPIDQVKTLTLASLVHNVGKVCMPKEILYKAGSLSKEEWEIMCTHPTKGAELLVDLQASKEVILTAMQHHERMDGAGYPSRLLGMEIHPFARICSIADVYDALTNHSPYQQALGPSEAIQKMLTMNGKFDPKILNMVTDV